MQLQHLSTVSWACWLGRPTVETIPNPSLGVSPFLFHPPDSPAAVADRNTPPDIARLSLLRSDISAGLSHRELTPLTHSRLPLALWRPHLHRGVCFYIYMCVCVCVCVCMCVCVCVCVCVTYVYSTFYLLHIISDAGELHLPIPFAIPDIRQLRYLPCYTPTTFLHPIRLLEFFSSCPSRLSPLDLTTPGHEQCHH